MIELNEKKPSANGAENSNGKLPKTSYSLYEVLNHEVDKKTVTTIDKKTSEKLVKKS